jgi:hypothetical protein
MRRAWSGNRDECREEAQAHCRVFHVFGDHARSWPSCLFEMSYRMSGSLMLGEGQAENASMAVLCKMTPCGARRAAHQDDAIPAQTEVSILQYPYRAQTKQQA